VKNRKDILKKVGKEAIGAAGLALAYTSVVALRYQWLKRKSRRDDVLTKKVRAIVGGRILRVYIYPGKGEIAAFASPSGEIFISDELYDMLDGEQSLAIALHEAGHIVYGTHLTIFFMQGIAARTVVDREGGAAALLASVAGTWIAGSALHERLADSYAVKKGYGKQLAEALDVIQEYPCDESFRFRDMPAYCQGKIDKAFHIHGDMDARIRKLANA
jgi:Zn-dependent protease with chaperone function